MSAKRDPQWAVAMEALAAAGGATTGTELSEQTSLFSLLPTDP